MKAKEYLDKCAGLGLEDRLEAIALGIADEFEILIKERKISNPRSLYSTFIELEMKWKAVVNLLKLKGDYDRVFREAIFAAAPQLKALIVAIKEHDAKAKNRSTRPRGRERRLGYPESISDLWSRW